MHLLTDLNPWETHEDKSRALSNGYMVSGSIQGEKGRRETTILLMNVIELKFFLSTEVF